MKNVPTVGKGTPFHMKAGSLVKNIFSEFTTNYRRRQRK